MTVSSIPPSCALRVAIIDDESIVRRGIRGLLREEVDIRLVGEAEDGRSAVELIRRERPDLVFLDVQLPEMTGFDVLTQIEPSSSPEVVFVTAYSIHAARAFDHYAVDYLLKPFDRTRFRVSLDRVRSRLGQKATEAGNPGRLVDRLPSSSCIERVLVHRTGRSTVIPIGEVEWFEAADNYVRIHTTAGRHLIRMKLSALEDKLDPRDFIRVHRSAIVRIDRVRELRAKFGSRYYLVLTTGVRLPLSRGYRDAVRAALAGVGMT